MLRMQCWRARALKGLRVWGLLCVVALAGCGEDTEPAGGPDADSDTGGLAAGVEAYEPPFIPKPPARELLAHNTEIASCVDCHGDQVRAWRQSHHALANRPMNPAVDEEAFADAGTVAHGTLETEIRATDEAYVIEAEIGAGEPTRMHPEAVIGVHPLRQYLIPFPDGRLQPVDVAYDPEKDEWFNVFGDEDRKPHEWGFWTNRGMTWNSQCAYCHMTFLDKGYDPVEDIYNTTWEQQGISCAQCHGDLSGHARSPEGLEQEFTPRQVMEQCASCHSRREELSGEWFAPGESFHDHYRLVLPDTPDVYYPDGQVLQENFVYGSFMMSKMGHKGVTCLDCHNPHSGMLKVPVENNALCMTCHATGDREAVVINPALHSNHPPGSSGALCVNCHMPETHFMKRDARRDHGFTIPDPLLTKELAIPNACNRCHTGESVDWAVEWTETWYGDRMNRVTRTRARLVAATHAGEAEKVGEYLAFARGEEIAAWRAVHTSLLGQWIDRSDVQAFLLEALQNDSPLVRSAAVRALSALPRSAPAIASLLDDPSRLVRIDAAWSLRDQLDPTSDNYAELANYLLVNSDRPSGAIRQSQIAVAQGQPGTAKAWLRRALEMDPQAAQVHNMLAVIHNIEGENMAALEALQEAVRLDPNDASHPYSLGLVYAEMGRQREAAEELRKAVDIEPEFPRAWYNLGLAYSQLGENRKAVKALEQAEAVAPQVPDFPYARATIHLKLGQRERARAAALRTLELNPQHQEAERLLQAIGN